MREFPPARDVLGRQLRQTAAALVALDSEETADRVEAIAAAISDALGAGGRALWFGNGGSAADAQHLAAELVGRFRLDRDPLAAISLVDNAAAVTAISNDYGFEAVFRRQIRALGRPGDVALGLTTSGTSENVLSGLAAARERGLTTVAFCGQHTEPLAASCDHVLSVPSDDTATVQEAHKLLGHVICGLVEQRATAG